MRWGLYSRWLVFAWVIDIVICFRCRFLYFWWGCNVGFAVTIREGLIENGVGFICWERLRTWYRYRNLFCLLCSRRWRERQWVFKKKNTKSRLAWNLSGSTGVGWAIRGWGTLFCQCLYVQIQKGFWGKSGWLFGSSIGVPELVFFLCKHPAGILRCCRDCKTIRVCGLRERILRSYCSIPWY